jgi:hypothetical protein
LSREFPSKLLGAVDIKQDFAAIATFGPSKQTAQNGETEANCQQLLDRVKKLNKYAGAGVSNYVIVDPEVFSLEWFRLEGEGYRMLQSLSEEGEWSFLGSTLKLTDFFANLSEDNED